MHSGDFSRFLLFHHIIAPILTHDAFPACVRCSRHVQLYGGLLSPGTFSVISRRHASLSFSSFASYDALFSTARLLHNFKGTVLSLLFDIPSGLRGFHPPDFLPFGYLESIDIFSLR